MRVSQALILIPVFVQVLLTLGVLSLLWWERVRFVKAERIAPHKVALAAPTLWSEQAQKLSNNFSNLLELPLLFYVVCLFALSLRVVDVWMLGFAGAFVASRIVHTAIHIGANEVMARFGAALVSMVVVSGMWILLFWRVASSGF